MKDLFFLILETEKRVTIKSKKFFNDLIAGHKLFFAVFFFLRIETMKFISLKRQNIEGFFFCFFFVKEMQKYRQFRHVIRMPYYVYCSFHVKKNMSADKISEKRRKDLKFPNVSLFIFIHFS